jgi:hypothetical protein
MARYRVLASQGWQRPKILTHEKLKINRKKQHLSIVGHSFRETVSEDGDGVDGLRIIRR